MKTFAQLFAGGLESYTTLRYVPGSNQDGHKLEGGVETIHAAPNVAVYDDHVAGKRSIGIVPIRKDGTVSFAVLDVDIYGRENSVELAKRVIATRNNPFVPCLSKSDGLHLYAFFDPAIPAKRAREFLEHWRNRLGIKAEIFPKQDKLADDALGNAINLPYFGNDRPALDVDGAPISLQEFLEFADSVVQQITKKEKKVKQPFFDGPPCIETKVSEGMIADNRNNWLFQMYVYYKKKYKSNELVYSQLMSLVPEHFERPGELSGQLDQYRKDNKKEYGYICDQFWAEELCDPQGCRKRPYGVGGRGEAGFTDTEFDIEEALVLYQNTGAPQYILKIDGKEVFFESIDHLTQFTVFVNAVFVATGKNMKWQGKRMEFPDWIRTKVAEKMVIDERSQNEYVTLEGVVITRFKAHAKDQSGLGHAIPGEPYVRHEKGKIWVPVDPFLEQIDKMRVALDKKFNRKHIDTVLRNFGCSVQQHPEDGAFYYVCDAWFEKEDERAKTQPYT